MLQRTATIAKGVAAAAVAALLAALLVGWESGGAAAEPRERPQRDRSPIALSADPERLEISSCLSKTLVVGMRNVSSKPVYADALIGAQAPVEISREAISSYLPVGYELRVPVRVSAPAGAELGEYEVLLEPGRTRGGPSRRGQVSVPVAVVAPENCVFEAESLLPAVEATAPASAQSNCCGIRWSGDAQLWFRASRADERVTVALEVPQAGTYDLSAVVTKAPDYGIHTLSVDGQAIGEPFDGYDADGVSTQEVEYGTLALSAGRHTLTLTVTGKNPASRGYFAGVDLFALSLDQGE
jgi:hypothetical protein